MIEGDVIDPQALIDHGLLRKDAYVKVLARGQLSAKLDVRAHAVSKAAEAAITAAGGTVTLVPSRSGARTGPGAQRSRATSSPTGDGTPYPPRQRSP